MSRRSADDQGDSFVVTLGSVVILLVALLMATNLIVDEYGRGVVRTAVDEGAQAGAVAGGPEEAVAQCEAKEAEVMSGLLAGGFGRHLSLSCSVQGELVTASADGRLPGWLPPVPSLAVRQLGVSHLEAAPTVARP